MNEFEHDATNLKERCLDISVLHILMFKKYRPDVT